MKFSVVFEAITQAFNKAVNDAGSNYRTATSTIVTESTRVNQSTAALSEKMRDIFAAKDASGIVSGFRAMTKELDGTKQGATLTATELRGIGLASKAATAELTANLKAAQAELKALQAAKATPTDIEQAKQKVNSLKAELSQVGVAYSQLQSSATAAMRRAAVEADALAGKMKVTGQEIYNSLNVRTDGSLRQEIAQITQQLADFKNLSKAPAEEVARVTAAAKSRIGELRAELGGIPGPANSAVSALRGIGGTAAAMTGVAIGLASIKQGVEATLAATMKFESVMKQLEFSLGGTTKAAEGFEFVRSVAREMGLELFSAANGYAKLSAATRGTRLEGELTQTIFKGITAAAATMQLSVDDTNGVILAMSQIISKGKVSMEELRGQLGERLPPAMQIAAKSMGVTTEQLEKMVEQGIDATSFMEKFGPAMVAAFSPTAAGNVQTLAGQLTLLKNEFSELLLTLGQSGIASGALEVVSDLRRIVGEFRTELQNIDPATLDAVKQSFQQLYDLGTQSLDTIITVVMEAVGAFNTLLEGVASVVQGFLGLEKSAEDVSFLTRTLQGVSIALGVLVDGVTGLGIAFQLVNGVVQSFFAAIALGLSKLTFGDLSRDLEEFSNKLTTSAQESFQKAQDSAMNFKSAAVAAADAAVGAHVAAAKKTGDAHVEAGTKAAAAQAGVGTAAAGAAQVIELSGTQGEKAMLGLGKAGEDVKKVFTDLAAEVGVKLPVLANTASLMGAALAEVATKSERVAEAIGDKLSEAVGQLDAKGLIDFQVAFVSGLEKAEASTELLNKALFDLSAAGVKVLGGDLAVASNQVSDGFRENTRVLNLLIANMGQLKSTGVDTGIALSQALDGMLGKAKNATEIQELIGYWERLGNQGLVTGDQLAEGMAKAKAKLDEVRPGINSVDEALKILGQTADTEAGLLASKYREAFNVLQASGTATFTQLTQGLQTMLQSARDSKDIEALIAKWRELGNAGKVAGYDMAEGVAQAKAKLDELKPGINSLAEAFKTFGMMSREETAALAGKYKDAFAVMESSGKATLAELQEAFKKYAETAISANGGVVDDFISGKAEALGLRVSVDEAGRALVEAANAGQRAGRAIKDGMDEASEGAQGLISWLDRLKKRNAEVKSELKMDKDGFAADDSGGRIVAVESQERLNRRVRNLFGEAAVGMQEAVEAANLKLKLDQIAKYGSSNLPGQNEWQEAVRQDFDRLAAIIQEKLASTTGSGQVAGGARNSGRSEDSAGGERVTIDFVGADGKRASVQTKAGTSVEDVIDTLRSAGASSVKRRK